MCLNKDTNSFACSKHRECKQACLFRNYCPWGEVGEIINLLKRYRKVQSDLTIVMWELKNEQNFDTRMRLRELKQEIEIELSRNPFYKIFGNGSDREQLGA